ncbi:hypothetical protein [Polaromonas sp.]|uniref:hypothetical protein n=1 Tax=Polaromonas sp. TaxID=1869339 RepID=UPI00352A872D
MNLNWKKHAGLASMQFKVSVNRVTKKSLTHADRYKFRLPILCVCETAPAQRAAEGSLVFTVPNF